MRVKNWEGALRAAVEAHRAKPFDWKTNNCVQFARAVSIAISGESPLPDLAVADEAAANAEIAARGSDLADAVAKLLPRIAPAQAGRGDIGIVVDKGNKVLVVVIDAFCAAPGPRCLRFISRTKLIDAFRID